MENKLIAGFLKVRNGILRNDLYHCLRNLEEYVDDLFVCSDASYDGTTQFLQDIIPEDQLLVVPLEEHSFAKELYHKQTLLDMIHKKGPYSYILWMDSDEILDAKGTKELRQFCINNLNKGYQGWAFHYTQCLDRNTPIYTEIGSKTIGWIVANRWQGKVLTLNTNNNLEYKNIIGWHKSKKLNRKLLKVSFADSSIDKISRKWGTVVTEDHEFLTKRDYIQAKDLKFDDLVATGKIFTNDKRFDQFIIGSLLGDGCIRKDYSFQIYHGIDQEEYCLLKANLLNNLNLTLYNRDYTNLSFGRKSLRRGFRFSIDQLKKYRHEWYPYGKNIPPKNIIKELDGFGLAIWYMDDGTLTKIKPQKSHHKNKLGEIKYYDRKESSKEFYYNVKIACGNVSEETINEFVKDFNEKGFNFYKIKKQVKGYDNIYWDLVLSREEEYNKFFEYIVEYIPHCMRYKIPEKYRDRPFNKETFDSIIPLSSYNNVIVEDFKNNHSDNYTVYCIDVEDNHNFVTPGGVVHNCWRNTCYARTDDNFDSGWFIKLWRYRPDLSFTVLDGTHQLQFPIQILESSKKNLIAPSPYEIIHYGNVGENLKFKSIQYRHGLGGVERHLLFDLKSTYRKIDDDLLPDTALKIQGDVPQPFTEQQVKHINNLFDLNKLKEHFCVIISAYNRADTLPRALDSLISQTYEKWHCVVCDDGSTDNTETVMRDYCAKDPRIFYAKYLDHKGGVAVNERGMEIAINTAEWWTRLGSDDWFLPHKLECDAKAFKAGHKAVYGPFVVNRDGVLMEVGNWPVPPESIKKGFLQQGFFASWANMAVHCDILRKIKEKYSNYVDPRLINMEDLLFNYRVSTLTDWIWTARIDKEIVVNPSNDLIQRIIDRKVSVEVSGAWNCVTTGASGNTEIYNKDHALSQKLIHEEQRKYE